MPSSTVTRETVSETPTLISRRRVDRDRLAETLAECLPVAFGYAMEKGLAMAGPPFVRYLGQAASIFEIEAGIPLVTPAGAVDNPDLLAGTLPGGDAVVTIHTGPYESLGATYAVLDLWIKDNEATSAGGPWEIYLTDPAEVADPNEWQTKIIWPLASDA